MHQLVRRLVQVPTSVSETHARSEFDRFGPLKRVPIRTPPKKDRLEKLRELRDSLTSGNLSPAQLLNRMRFYSNLNMLEAVTLAERECALIVPNIIHDTVLNQTSVRYISWTGTLVIYEAPNQPFKDSVTFRGAADHSSHSLSFRIPKEFRGKINCALVIEHPDFTFVKTGENKYEVKLTEGAECLVIPFPQEKGSYKQNVLGIPNGWRAVKSDKDARYLWRFYSHYAGPLVRSDNYFSRSDIHATYEVRSNLQLALIG